MVEQLSSMARFMLSRRTRNASELQVAAVTWEMAVVEHEWTSTEVVLDSGKTAAMLRFSPKNQHSNASLMDSVTTTNFVRVWAYIRVRSWPGKK